MKYIVGWFWHTDSQQAALALMGKIQNILRLPLVPLRPELEPVIRASLEAIGALS